MKLARGLLLFSYGLFSIAAQALLFREFITTFEGNDISVGVFFASWFLWVGVGALLVRRLKTADAERLEGTEGLFLIYLPAFVLQAVLIVQARQLAGLQSYALWSVRDILLVSVLVNAPISLVTGTLFPIACRWFESGSSGQRGRLPVSRVYIFEATGSFAGGIGVTILLGFGVSSAAIFFALALVLSLSVFAVSLPASFARAGARPGARRVTCIASSLVLLAASLCLILRTDKPLMRYIRVVKWSKLLPKEAFAGSFQTAQAEYLYGMYQGQWVAVREGAVVDALPDKSAAGRIAALVLCQKPDAKNVLVVGSGLGVCRELLNLPQIETVTWTHCDVQYVQKVNQFIPAGLRITDPRLHRLAGDVRSLLAGKRETFDAVIVNLPDATSSVLNRYYTVEFYRQIKQCLSPSGVLAVRIAGGENIMGTELVDLGASTKRTLEQVFSKLALVPGENTWFIASNSPAITGEPGTLRDRFASIKGSRRVFVPDALLSVYLPDRAAAALESYARADLPQWFLINRDSRPLTHLYSLLLTAKESGAPAARLVKHLLLAGPVPFLIPILILVILRNIYILRPPPQGGPSGFDSGFLVFSTGAAGIGAVIILMYLYQARFGSLYLHIGVVSSLFMAGLAGGAALARRLLPEKEEARTETLLLLLVVIHSLVLGVIAFWPDGQWSHPVFAAAFVLCGLCTGGYFPIAAKQLADSGFETGRAGSTLETADHLGAAAGGLMASLALVPVLGAKATLFVFVVLIFANAPAAALKLLKPERIRSLGTARSAFRGLGYCLFGVGVSAVLCSNLLARAGANLNVTLPQRSVQALAGELHVEKQSALVGRNHRKVDYYKVRDANNVLTGYIFSSQDFAPEVRGFGGKINLAVYVADPNDKLIDFHVVRSNETPSYLELLHGWWDSLTGHRLFEPEPFAGVHAVTGATISSKAILLALRTSGRRFATQVLGRSIGPAVAQSAPQAKYLPDNPSLYLIGVFVLALIVTYIGGFWSRLAVLCLSLAVGGLWLNAQYSSEQIVTLLTGYAPAAALTGAFLFIVGVPLLVAIFGNVYCGYICPFGAAQEIISYVVPTRLKRVIPTESMRKARFVKYIVLLVVLLVFFASRDRTTLAGDPLISVFSLPFTIHVFQAALPFIVAAALFGSIFCTRFWCRYVCPAGAFLSLLNGAALLKRYLPARKFGRCPFGVTGRDKMDCIQCDKCRFETFDRAATAQSRKNARVFLACVLVVAIFASCVSVGRFLQVVPAGAGAVSVSTSAGQPRNVDIQQVRKLIREKKLSDKEAEFYKKIE
jgi:predicted membrane-bound spermidine synthase/Na+-translocating ferredoxin:NAD+ oxidoreductase RnfG subunit